MPNATLTNFCLKILHISYELRNSFFFSFGVEKGLFDRPTVIFKRKEGSLQTNELKEISVCLHYCKGWLVLSHFWCFSLYRNYLRGQGCRLMHSTGRRQCWSSWYSLSISSTISCCSAPLTILKTLLLPCLYESFAVSQNNSWIPTRKFVQAKDTSKILTLYPLRKTSFTSP